MELFNILGGAATTVTALFALTRRVVDGLPHRQKAAAQSQSDSKS